ncbi:MAG: GGDEF domain-containing protein [Eubacteriales bacterium]|jgi:diguanylate cyclase (GGDEF)-like protein
MIDYRTIIYMADGIGLLLQVMILISGRTGRNVRSSTTRLYYLAVVLNMILCALDFPVFYFDGLRTGYTVGLLYVLNTVQALLLTCMTYVWFRFVTRRAGVRDDWRVFRMVAPIPLFLVVVLYLVNLAVPVIFRVADYRYLPDGPLYPVPFLIDICYFIGGSVYGIIAAKRSKDYQFFPYIYVLIFTETGSIIQFIDFRISVIYFSVSLAYLAIFMEKQNENSYIDPLSRVYNRQFLSRYVARVCSSFSSNSGRKLVFLMIDVDEFKKINDTYGHKAGDDAIRDMGSLLLEARPSGSICARYGGDEFIMVLEVHDLSEVNDVIDRLNERRRALNESGTRPYQLHISFGSSAFVPEHDRPDDVFRRVDQEMYKQKRIRHSRRKKLHENNLSGR